MGGAVATDELRIVGIIGDVHTEADTLKRVLDHLAGFDLDHILCTGDLPDGPGEGYAVDRCAELLQQADVLSICGNHDRWLDEGEMRGLPDATYPDEVAEETREYLRGLPPTREFDTPIGRLLFCHGIGHDDMAGVKPHERGSDLERNEPLQALLREGRYTLVVNGHTHRRMVRAIGRVTIINAGTLLRTQEPGFVVADFRNSTVRFYDIPEDGPITESERFDI
jgi:predicted phosphodiesterase